MDTNNSSRSRRGSCRTHQLTRDAAACARVPQPLVLAVLQALWPPFQINSRLWHPSNSAPPICGLAQLSPTRLPYDDLIHTISADVAIRSISITFHSVDHVAHINS